MLWDALGLGMRMLMFSADVAMGEEEADFEGPVAWGTVALSLLMAIGIFFVGPLLFIGWVERFMGEGVFSNVLEGVIRLLMFVGYVWAIGFLPDIRRVFGYHGAEHKAINAYENGVPLIPAEIDGQSINPSSMWDGILTNCHGNLDFCLCAVGDAADMASDCI